MDWLKRKIHHTHLQRGAAAEHLACNFLQRQGLFIVQRNYRCRCGEIDIIARDQQPGTAAVLCFVEVRCRSRSSHGRAAETVDRRKQKKLINCAQHYLIRHPTHVKCRFDVIEVSYSHRGDARHDGTHMNRANINWIRDAFWS